MRIINLILMTALTLPVFSFELNVEKCKKLALENSEEIQIAEKQKDIADSRKIQYRSNFFPKISFDLSYMYKFDELKYSLDEAYLPTYVYQDGGLVPNILINPADQQPVIGPDGNPVFNEYAYFPGMDLSLSLKHSYFASVKAEQPLFFGGKIINAYKMAKIGSEAAKINYDREKENLLIETELAYWRLVSLRQKIILAEKYEMLVKQTVKQLIDAEETGMIQQNCLLKAKVKLNEAKLKKQKALHGNKLATLDLARILGTELPENINLADSIINIPANVDIDISETMFVNRKDYKLLQAKYNIAEKEKAVAFAEYLPEIGISASYSEVCYELNDNEEKSRDTTIMANFSLPLFKWGETYAKNRQAKLKKEQSKLELDKNTELMKLEIKKNEFALKDAELRHATSVEYVRQATENLRVANDNFNLKRVTLTNLLEAQTEWEKAKSEKIDAATDYQKAYLNLLRSVGKLY
ncbi:MAG: hypothetical protein CSB55_04515 [Candidatus Cloacimonadota bacterium]|nr:MAG: hypothetical protein CSB55_04515 [Candidatus Cloacimonadota bacterium]